MSLFDDHPELLDDLKPKFLYNEHPELLQELQPAERQHYNNLQQVAGFQQTLNNDRTNLKNVLAPDEFNYIYNNGARPTYDALNQTQPPAQVPVQPQQQVMGSTGPQGGPPIEEMNQSSAAPGTPDPSAMGAYDMLGILGSANQRAGDRQVGALKELFGADPQSLKAYYDNIHQQEAQNKQQYPGGLANVLRAVGGSTLPVVEAAGSMMVPGMGGVLGQTGTGAVQGAAMADPGSRSINALIGGVAQGGLSALGGMTVSNTPAQAMQAYKAGGTLAQVTGGRQIRGVENALSKHDEVMGGLEDTYVGQSEDLVNRLKQAIPEVDTRNIYTNGPAEIKAQNAKLQAANQAGYDDAYMYADKVGQKVPMTNTLKALDELEQSIAKPSPGLESSTKSEALDRIQKFKEGLTSSNGLLDPATIRANTAEAGDLAFNGSGALKRFGAQTKSALRNDFKDFAENSGDPELYNKFKQADAFYHDTYSPWKEDHSIKAVLEGTSKPKQAFNNLVKGQPAEYLDKLGLSPETRAALNSREATPIREAAIGLKGEASPMKAAKAARRLGQRGNLDPNTQAELDNVVSDIRVLKAKNNTTPTMESPKGLYEKATNIASYLPKLAYSTIARPGSIGPYIAAHAMQQQELTGAGLKALLYGLQSSMTSASPKQRKGK